MSPLDALEWMNFWLGFQVGGVLTATIMTLIGVILLRRGGSR